MYNINVELVIKPPHLKKAAAREKNGLSGML